MRSLFILYFLITPVVAMSCAIGPIFRIAEHPAEYLSRYTRVFLGEIIEIIEAGKAEQLVEMRVLEIFKGKPGITACTQNFTQQDIYRPVPLPSGVIGERFRGNSPVMIEIGVMGGGSLEMWKQYFGQGSHIIGIDVDPECKAHESDGIEVVIGSQDDPGIIDTIFSKYPNIDIVLDDGSHMMQHMISSFELMYHRIKSEGVYIVEDTHTCYHKHYGGGLGRRGSFMEFVKQKLDDINAVHIGDTLPVTEFTHTTDYIACYDSVVVFEKKPQGKRQAPITHGM